MPKEDNKTEEKEVGIKCKSNKRERYILVLL